MFKAFVTGLAFALAALSFAPAAIAQQQPNLLNMDEDADLATVPRNSRIFNRVLRAIEGELQVEGFASTTKPPSPWELQIRRGYVEPMLS